MNQKVITIMARMGQLLFAVSLLVVCGIMSSSSASGETFDSNGVKLHFIVEGKGQPVILIHGLHSSIRMNWQMPGVVSALARNYQVIALDMPGHGESDKPTLASAYGTEMVEDIVRLMDHLNIRRAHIVGYSMGGMIAMKFLALHQDRAISGLIGGMGWLRDGSPLQSFWDRIPEREGRGTPPACARSLGKLALTEAELKSIRVPTEVVVGDRDPTKRLYVTQLEEKRKDWPIVEIQDAGHMNCIVKPEFKKALFDWLERH